MHDEWQTTLDLAKKRSVELEEERSRQLANEEMRKRFISLASELNAWLEQTQGRLNNVGLVDVSLEGQVKLVATLAEELAAQRPKLTELEECHQVGEPSRFISPCGRLEFNLRVFVVS